MTLAISSVPTTKATIPLTGVAPYQGGKRLLAKTIIQRIEAIPHLCYAEPFVGMGGVFFRRRQIPTVEVINDYNQEIANLLRILQRHQEAFIDMMRFQISSRAEFERLDRIDPTTLTDLERAARTYYLQRQCYGGRYRNPVYGVATKEPSRFNFYNLAPQLEEFHERLSGVVLECLPYEEFIKRYDRPTTFFYLDPPYYDCEKDYGPDLFFKEDFSKLARLLSGLQGNFLLSLNDHPVIREIFADFHMETVETTYSIRGGEHAKRVKEVLISKKTPTLLSTSFADEGSADAGGSFDDSLA